MCKYFLYFWGWFEFKLPWYMKTHCMWNFYIIEIYIVFCIILIDCASSVCMHLFMDHIVSRLHILKERIFVFMCILTFFLFLKFGLCLFIFPHLLHFSQSYFSQNLFCFSYFYRGRKLVLKPVLFIRRVITLHRGSCLYFL